MSPLGATKPPSYSQPLRSFSTWDTLRIVVVTSPTVLRLPAVSLNMLFPTAFPPSPTLLPPRATPTSHLFVWGSLRLVFILSCPYLYFWWLLSWIILQYCTSKIGVGILFFARLDICATLGRFVQGFTMSGWLCQRLKKENFTMLLNCLEPLFARTRWWTM